MPTITRQVLPLSNASTLAFFDHHRAKGHAVRVQYQKKDGTREWYTICNPTKEAQAIIALHASIGRSRAPVDRKFYRQVFVAGKGWRTFLNDGFCDIIAKVHVKNTSLYQLEF